MTVVGMVTPLLLRPLGVLGSVWAAFALRPHLAWLPGSSAGGHSSGGALQSPGESAAAAALGSWLQGPALALAAGRAARSSADEALLALAPLAVLSEAWALCGPGSASAHSSAQLLRSAVLVQLYCRVRGLLMASELPAPMPATVPAPLQPLQQAAAAAEKQGEGTGGRQSSSSSSSASSSSSEQQNPAPPALLSERSAEAAEEIQQAGWESRQRRGSSDAGGGRGPESREEDASRIWHRRTRYEQLQQQQQQQQDQLQLHMQQQELSRQQLELEQQRQWQQLQAQALQAQAAQAQAAQAQAQAQALALQAQAQAQAAAARPAAVVRPLQGGGFAGPRPLLWQPPHRGLALPAMLQQQRPLLPMQRLFSAPGSPPFVRPRPAAPHGGMQPPLPAAPEAGMAVVGYRAVMMKVSPGGPDALQQ